jgi:hypothetical protein
MGVSKIYLPSDRRSYYNFDFDFDNFIDLQHLERTLK